MSLSPGCHGQTRRGVGTNPTRGMDRLNGWRGQTRLPVCCGLCKTPASHRLLMPPINRSVAERWYGFSDLVAGFRRRAPSKAPSATGGGRHERAEIAPVHTPRRGRRADEWRRRTMKPLCQPLATNDNGRREHHQRRRRQGSKRESNNRRAATALRRPRPIGR